MTPWELKAAYKDGKNLLHLLKDESKGGDRTSEHVELSYDLQSGAYARGFDERPEVRERKRTYTKALLDVFRSLGRHETVLDAGVGEGTTLWSMFSQLDGPCPAIHGVDLCWSRVAVCRDWLSRQQPQIKVELVCGTLTQLPYAANSFDIVYTTHALEPNHGLESQMLSELYRVAARYVVLVEPAYELADEVSRARMDQHGYCRGLPEEAQRLGFNVVRHEMFVRGVNPLNPSALLVLEKDPASAPTVPQHVCPAYKTPLAQHIGCYYSPESMRAYPIIGGIPCLRSSHAVVASRLADFCSPCLP
jgi:ubiquinone/menaquinone biosynthesis C-methylase UbiE/uncharacterized protein YbaR (Trm112 family)